MLNSKLIAIACAALAAFIAEPAAAQAQDIPTELRDQAGDPSERSPTGTNIRPRRQRASGPTAEQVRATTQGLITQSGVACQLKEAALLGETQGEQKAVAYEAVCEGGVGYLAIASTPAKVISCLELAGQAMITRERDPNADVGQQCTLPVNLDPLPPLTAFASQAALPCTVDQGAAIGTTDAGNVVYEIGCSNGSGWWLERASDGWVKTPCWDVTLKGDRCRFTTADEVRDAWRGNLTSTAAAPCDVDTARIVGRDGQGLNVYELKCASGDGYFARVDNAWAVKRIQTCAEAANVAGGCRLTTATATPAPAPSGGRI